MFLDVNKVDRNIILKKVPLKFVTMKNMLGTFWVCLTLPSSLEVLFNSFDNE